MVLFQRFHQLDPNLAIQFNKLLTAKAQAESAEAAQRASAAPPPGPTLALPGPAAMAQPVEWILKHVKQMRVTSSTTPGQIVHKGLRFSRQSFSVLGNPNMVESLVAANEHLGVNAT